MTKTGQKYTHLIMELAKTTINQLKGTGLL